MNIIKSLVRNNNNLNIVDSFGHTPGFYGFIFDIKFFLNIYKSFHFNEAKTTEVQLILTSAGAVSFN